MGRQNFLRAFQIGDGAADLKDAAVGALLLRIGKKSAARLGGDADGSQADQRAKAVKPQDLIDRRYLSELEKSGFFGKLWGGRR